MPGHIVRCKIKNLTTEETHIVRGIINEEGTVFIELKNKVELMLAPDVVHPKEARLLFDYNTEEWTCFVLLETVYAKKPENTKENLVSLPY